MFVVTRGASTRSYVASDIRQAAELVVLSKFSKFRTNELVLVETVVHKG